MSIRTVKRLSSDLLDAGSGRVRFNPAKMEDISKALTREDVRALIKSRDIYAIPEKEMKSTSGKLRNIKRRRGRRRGFGKRRGTQKVRTGRRSAWHLQLRTQRAYLRQLLKEGAVNSKSYRKLYLLSKGNMFKGKRAVMSYIETHGLGAKKKK